jgi:small multidrug resistance pump
VIGAGCWGDGCRVLGDRCRVRTNLAFTSGVLVDVRPNMDDKIVAILVTVGFSLVGVLGDYYLKLASGSEHSLRTPWFYIGFAVYASTAFGWVFVMKSLKLATIGVVYSVSMIVLLTLVGVVFFRESMTLYEVAGVILAIVSLILLVRFA